MKIRICFLLVIFLALNPLSTVAMTPEQWTYVDNIASQALSLTKEKEYDKAETMLIHFSNELLNIISNEEEISNNQEKVIRISYDEAKQALFSQKSSHEEKVRHVMQLRFAVNALYTVYQPLWVEMEQTVMGSFVEMKENITEGHHNVQAINDFLENMNVIYPSLVIDLNADQIEKLNSHIEFLEEYENVSAPEQLAHLEKMEKDLVHLFDTLHMNETDPSFIWVTVSIATVIFVTLFYVAWKKYRGESPVVNV